MTKAYDFEALGEALKSDGLTLTEQGARALFLRVVGWLDESAKLSSTLIDDIALSLLNQYKALALKEIDKIDGKTSA